MKFNNLHIKNKKKGEENGEYNSLHLQQRT